jgi:hypothetical protein
VYLFPKLSVTLVTEPKVPPLTETPTNTKSPWTNVIATPPETALLMTCELADWNAIIGATFAVKLTEVACARPPPIPVTATV